MQSRRAADSKQTEGGGDRRQQHPLSATEQRQGPGSRFVRAPIASANKLVSWSATAGSAPARPGQTEDRTRPFPVKHRLTNSFPPVEAVSRSRSPIGLAVRLRTVRKILRAQIAPTGVGRMVC